MAEFFGIGGYKRAPEGFLSWQHLVFASVFLVVMVLLAVFFGHRYKNKSEKEKNKVLIVSAILIDLVEIGFVILVSIRNNAPDTILYHLPFFLCTLQLVTIPLAAFSKGIVRDASLDFVFIFGMLAAVMGNIGAGQNFSAYPVLSVENVESAVMHCISGFASLYIAISGLKSMKKRNIPITFAIITLLSIVAYIADVLIPYNYMFLIRGDGTPYDIIYNLVNGNPVLYPVLVILLFIAYIAVFYLVYYLVTGKAGKNKKRV